MTKVKVANKIAKRVPLARVSQMVVDALRCLKRPGGCSAISITNFIRDLHGENDQAVLKKVPLALKRGVNFGAITKTNDNYKLEALMMLAARTISSSTSAKPLPKASPNRKQTKSKKTARKKSQKPKRQRRTRVLS